MKKDLFILKKRVNWSLLNDGFNISTSERSIFNLYMPEILNHGENRNICIIINGQKYKAALKNENFNTERWPNRRDIIQIRYSNQSEIAKKLRSIFNQSYKYLQEKRTVAANGRQQIILPEYINEYFVLLTTADPYTYEMVCFNGNDNDHIIKPSSYITEQEYESLENDEMLLEQIREKVDPKASIEECARIVKTRKIDRTIIDNLKEVYEYRCQITGEKVGEEFGRCVIEAHHIEYFTQSLNNDAKNIIIISPNYHRIIHKNNPHFNSETKTFEFDNGARLPIKLNFHL